MRGFTYLLVIIVLLVSLFCFFTGTINLCAQININSQSVPVEATIIESKVLRSGYNESTLGTVKPYVKYSYNYQGRNFESNSIASYKRITGETWAEYINNKYSDGKIVTAYVNPNYPDIAVLESISVFGPYGEILFSLLLTTLAFSIIHFELPNIQEPILQRDRTVKIKPIWSIKRKFIFYSLNFSFLIILGLPLCLHFLKYQKDAVIYEAYLQILFYGLICFIFLMFMFKWMTVLFLTKELDMFVNSDELALGDKIEVEIKHKFRSNVNINFMAVNLVCKEVKIINHKHDDVRCKKSNVANTKKYNISNTMLESLNLDIVLPKIYKASTGKNFWATKKVPKVDWFIDYIIKIKYLPKTKIVYPIIIFENIN